MSEGPNGSDEEEEEDALLVEAGCWFWTIAEGLKAFVVSESTNHSKRIGFLPSSCTNCNNYYNAKYIKMTINMH